MSRPPVHRPVVSPRGIARDDSAQARYFGENFSGLVRLAEALARDAYGIEIPEKERGFARTLIEIPALFAHILGEHQSLYAREAYLGTASLPDSLSRHARKLAYVPDAGVAATGLAAFTVKEGLSGELPKGFALQSAPKGEAKAQTYETLAAVTVDAAWNTMKPHDATVPTPMAIVGGRLEVPLTRRHGLERGAVVLVEGQGHTGVFRVEDPMKGSTLPRLALTRIDVAGGSETWPAVTDGYRLHIRPQTETRVFGWNADATLYPPSVLASPTAYTNPSAVVGEVGHGYELPNDPSPPPVALGEELYLAEAIEAPEVGSFAALLRGTSASAYTIDSAGDRPVLFKRGEQMSLPNPPSGSTVTFPLEVIKSSISARVTALGLSDIVTGAAKHWSAATPFPLDGVLLTSWDDQLEVAPRVPNTDAFELTVTLGADLTDLRPGRPAILKQLDNGDALETSISALIAPSAPGAAWQAILSLGGAGLPTGWQKGNVAILGNVAKVSHGESKSEAIGGSDGVTPHQPYALKGVPVTRVPGALGSEIALEIRVDGVLWDRVEDFHQASPEARLCRTETDAKGKVTVYFGGEGRGSVPPAGKRNVTAAYRIGLGAIGDAEAGRLSRIPKSSPLLDSVTNPLPFRGGTDPVGTDDLRAQATRPVRTFDRAVSVADYADLALMFPGVARTSARWLGRGAVELVTADASGQPTADQAGLRAFLDARRDTGVPLTLLDPQAVEVAVTLRVERDAAWLSDAVRIEVEDALIGTGDSPGLFAFAARALSQPQSLSGLYARILDLAGVTGVEATRFAVKPATGVADILHATDRQWLTLRASDLDISIVEPKQLVPDVEGSGS